MPQEKPYVIIYFPYTNPRKAFCLNRRYEYMGDGIELWGDVKLKDIVEVDDKFMPTFENQRPLWVKVLLDSGVKHIAIWTNYYESQAAEGVL